MAVPRWDVPPSHGEHACICDPRIHPSRLLAEQLRRERAGGTQPEPRGPDPGAKALKAAVLDAGPPHKVRRPNAAASSAPPAWPAAAATAVWASQDLALKILKCLPLQDLYCHVRRVARSHHRSAADSALWTRASVQGIEIWQRAQLRGLFCFLWSCGRWLRELSFHRVQADSSILRQSAVREDGAPPDLGVLCQLPVLERLHLDTYGARGETAWAEWVLSVLHCPKLRALRYTAPMSAKALEGIAGLVQKSQGIEEVRLHFTSHSKAVWGTPLRRLADALLSLRGGLRVLELQPLEGTASVVWSPGLLSDAAPELLQALFENSLASESSPQSVSGHEAPGSEGSSPGLKSLAIGYVTDDMCRLLVRPDGQAVPREVGALALLSEGPGGSGLTPGGVGAVLRAIEPAALERLRVRCEWGSAFSPQELDRLWFRGIWPTSAARPEADVVGEADNLSRSSSVDETEEMDVYRSTEKGAAGFPNLREFNCFGLRWTSALLRVLARRCPALEALRLHNIEGVDDAALKAILVGLGRRLVSLSLKGRGGQISDSGARALLRHRQRGGRLQHLELDINRHMTRGGVAGLVRGLVELGSTRLSMRAWDLSAAVDNELAGWVCHEAPESLISFRCGLELLEDGTKVRLAQRFPRDFYRREGGEVRPLEDQGGHPFWCAKQEPLLAHRGRPGEMAGACAVKELLV